MASKHNVNVLSNLHNVGPCPACQYNAKRRKTRAEIRNRKTIVDLRKNLKQAPIVTSTKNATSAPKTIKNHFILVRDRSASMRQHVEGARKLFNAQIEALKQTRDQQSCVTIFDFGDDDFGGVQERMFNNPVSDCLMMLDYAANGGSTPLYDAIAQAGGRALADTDPDVSFVMVVLTDGQENSSQRATAEHVRAFIQTQQATDRWTFVFLVPPGYKNAFVNKSGVHPDNVKEWDNAERAAQETYVGTQSYLAARTASKGKVRSSKHWFTTDASNISINDLRSLRDVSGQVKTYTVDKECDVQSFINVKTGGEFAPGRTFFELMKKEDEIQDYKELLLQDKTTGRIYANGMRLAIRALLGLPLVGNAAIDPGNHANYRVYVQSMSTNRKLPRGTKVVFWKK